MATNTFYSSGRVALPTAVPPGGTVVLPYPAGSSQGTFTGGMAGAVADNVVLINDNDRYTGAQVSFTYGAGGITITNNTQATWPANANIRTQYPLANQMPITGAKGATIATLVDSSGGAVSNAIAAIAAGGTYTQADMTAVKNALASLAAITNQQNVALRAANIITT